MEIPAKDRPNTWNSHRRGKTPAYEYKTLKEVASSTANAREVVNVYGVVIDFRETKKSKGTDFFCVLRIMDPTFHQSDGVKVMLFHSESDQLPRVSEFDIIRLHRVRIDKYMSQVSLLSSRAWSWVIWSGKTADPIENGVSGSETYTVTDTDKEKVNELRKWVKTQKCKDPSLDGVATDENKLLSDVTSGSFFNWICQVVAIAIPRDDAAILKVWDGTLPNHKISLSPILNEVTEFATLPNTPDLDPYLVQVTVFDNHVKMLRNADIGVGSYVRICNLHASPKRQQAVSEPDQQPDPTTELFLHEGLIFDRGILPVDEDMEETTKMIEKQGPILEDRRKMEQDSQLSVVTPTKKRPLSPSPMKTPAIIKKQKLNIEVTPSDDGYRTPPQTLGLSSQDTTPIPSDSLIEKVTAQPEESQDTLRMFMEMDNQGQSLQDSNATNTVESCEVSTQESTTSTVRCHQESCTVVFGDGSPLNVTKIRDVIKADVPVRTSKLFRIRAKVQKCSDPQHLVYHHCPATGINIVAVNDGENLKIPEDLHQWLTKWRKLSGFDQTSSPHEGDTESAIINVTAETTDDEDVNTQWPVPGLPDDITMSSYHDNDDNSNWQSMTCKNHVIRKRKCDDNKFTILYDSKDQESLKNLCANYDRVVRVLDIEDLTNSSLPPLAYQDGVYYYCSPGCVSSVSIPPLSEESKYFCPSKPTQALSCPLLIPRFYVMLQFGDDSDHLVATLRGKSAISFFNGVTPGKYLTDPKCSKALADELKRLLGENDSPEAGETPFVEVVIEKKSRRAVDEDDPPVILYDVINTRLRLL